MKNLKSGGKLFVVVAYFNVYALLGVAPFMLSAIREEQNPLYEGIAVFGLTMAFVALALCLMIVTEIYKRVVNIES